MNNSKIEIPLLGGFATEDAAEGDPTVRMGFKLNCKDSFPGVKTTLISNILDDFAYPEIMFRVKQGLLTPEFKLFNLHIVLYNDSRNNEVLLNNEVRFVGLVQLKNKDRAYGEPILMNDIEDVLGIYPSKQNDPNAAHIMLFKFKGDWLISCDFFYNKQKNKGKLQNAISFLKAAKLCMDENLLGPFVDNLFSATELAIQGILLYRPTGNYSKRQSHDKTSELLESYTTLGNLDMKYWNHFKKLRELRLRGRYLNAVPEGNFSLDNAISKELIDNTVDLIGYVEKMMETIDFSSRLPNGEYIVFGQA
jgi:hypothetical protein